MGWSLHLLLTPIKAKARLTFLPVEFVALDLSAQTLLYPIDKDASTCITETGMLRVHLV